RGVHAAPRPGARLRNGRCESRQDHRCAHSVRWRQAVRSGPGRLTPRHGGLHRAEVCLPRYRSLISSDFLSRSALMLDRSNELNAWDRDHFFHPSSHMAQHARGETPNRIMTGGEGVYVVDRERRKSLDAFAGLYCVNVGYGRREIAEAIAEQASRLPYYHAYVGHGSEPSIRLAKMIIDRAPEGMSRVYFGLSGSDANETNIKLIWYYNNILGRPEKKKIISRWRGYHGSGVMTGSLTGLAAFHNAFDLPRAPILHTEAPYYFRRPDLS